MFVGQIIDILQNYLLTAHLDKMGRTKSLPVLEISINIALS